MSQDIQYPQPEATPIGHSDRDRVMAERVAVLGTGIMGAPMARNLLNAGFEVRVWNRTPDKARVLAADGGGPRRDARRRGARGRVRDHDAHRHRRGPGGDGAGGGLGPARRRLAPDQHGHGRGARGRAREGSRVHVRELSCDRHPGDGQAGPAGGARVRTRRRPRPAQPIFDAIGSKTVRLEPEAGGMSRTKLVVSAWTRGIVESLRAQLGRAARWVGSRTSAGR